MRTTHRIVLFTLMSLSTAVWASAQTEGIKETDRFIKTGRATSQSVAEARLRTKNALDAYNLLVQGSSKDMKGDYKKLLGTQKDMNNQVAEARKVIAEMEKQAAVYFTSRSRAVDQIKDNDLRDKAKSRVDDSQKEYDKVMASLKDGGEALTPFAQDLSDNIKYLGAELNPSSIASLQPQATKLNERGSNLLTQVDSAVSTANNYFSTLRAE